jgi:hypothetical protein
LGRNVVIAGTGGTGALALALVGAGAGVGAETGSGTWAPIVAAFFFFLGEDIAGGAASDGPEGYKDVIAVALARALARKTPTSGKSIFFVHLMLRHTFCMDWV